MREYERPLQILLIVGIGIVLSAMLLPAIQQARETSRRPESLVRMNTLKCVGLLLSNYEQQHQSLPSMWSDEAHELQQSTWARDLAYWDWTHDNSRNQKLNPKYFEDRLQDYFFDRNLTPEGGTTAVVVIDPQTRGWNETWKVGELSVRCVSLPYDTLAVDRQRGWVTVDQAAEYFRTTHGNQHKLKMYALLADGSVKTITELPH